MDWPTDNKGNERDLTADEAVDMLRGKNLYIEGDYLCGYTIWTLIWGTKEEKRSGATWISTTNEVVKATFLGRGETLTAALNAAARAVRERKETPAP